MESKGAFLATGLPVVKVAKTEQVLFSDIAPTDFLLALHLAAKRLRVTAPDGLNCLTTKPSASLLRRLEPPAAP